MKTSLLFLVLLLSSGCAFADANQKPEIQQNDPVIAESDLDLFPPGACLLDQETGVTYCYFKAVYEYNDQGVYFLSVSI